MDLDFIDCCLSNGSPAPLPPIGSDVRRRADERAGACMAGGAGGAGPGAAGADHSLFYFNGEQPPPAPAPDGYWRPERAAYPPPVPDYRPDYGECMQFEFLSTTKRTIPIHYERFQPLIRDIGAKHHLRTETH